MENGDKFINPNQICSIKSCLKDKTARYVYKEEKVRGFWFMKKIYPAGFYKTILCDSYGIISKEEILKNKNLIIENNTVYYKPYLEITMSNGKNYSVFFENEKELNTFALRLGDFPWVKV